MIRRWHFWVAVVAVLAGLGFGIRSAVTVSSSVPAVPAPVETPSTTPLPTPVPPLLPTTSVPTSVPPSISSPEPTATAKPRATQEPTKATPSPTPTPATGPPEGTVGTASRYRQNYGARYVGWDELITKGKPLPAATASCNRSWRSARKDGRLDWSDAQHWCLESLNGRAYKPQGVGGSGTAVGYTIGGRPATDRNLVLITWYSRVKEQARFANSGGESATKMTVIDLEQKRYNTVELVRPAGERRFDNIDSHGSGIAWAGQYLYTSSLSVLWMYNADDLMKIDGRYVLPAVSRWSTGGSGGLSSISVERSSGTSRLTGINYTTSGKTYIQNFPLTASGRLATGADKSSKSLTLRNTFGPDGSLHSSSTSTASGNHYQGVARTGPYTFANSTYIKGLGNATVVLKQGRVIKRLKMPRTNVESVYLDPKRDTFVSVTEHGMQFLFSVPLASLITTAER